ncbi:MAG: hypothetical protein QXT63_04995, partial [Thermoplasmata archaeon]
MHYTNSVSTKISIYAISQIYSDEKTRSERVIAELFAKYHPSLEERESIVENVHGTLKMQGRIDYILKQLSIDTKIYDDTEIAILRLATFLTFLTKSPKSAESAEKSRHVPSKPKSWKSHNSKRSKPTKTSKPEIHKQDLKNELIKELISVTRSLGVKNVKLENDLKKIINESEKVEYPDRISNRLEYISTYHSHPYWFVKWVSTWLGVDETERFCEANNHEPPLVIRANTLKISREELAKLLKEEGFDTIPTKYSPFGLVAKQKGDIYKTKSFSNGYFETQDEASQLVTMLAKPPNRGKIVDACAGSGGKTIFLSALMENKGRI